MPLNSQNPLLNKSRQPAIVIAAGWKEDSSHYNRLVQNAEGMGWRTAVVTFPQEHEEAHTRRTHMRLLTLKADEIFGPASSNEPANEASLHCLLGFSYGAYLGILLSHRRSLAGMLLRSPAIYGDKGWDVPKDDLDDGQIDRLREHSLQPSDSQALLAASVFRGDLVLVECDKDQVVPHPTHVNYFYAFERARSRQYRILEGADHQITDPRLRQDFEDLVLSWLASMRSATPLANI